ncbi:MAG: Lrp/AsnC family transcriptional regulator [Sphingomonadales bacterium]|nr:Lrp/AsnC family transcriptional regulator [Sphingomonadales bacterium]
MTKISISPIDRKILLALQEDGRMTNQDLSERVGLSPSPCLRRVRALEESGVIDRYVALVDPAKLNLSVTAFVRVRLERQDDTGLEIFERTVASLPEVMDCYLMTGDCDYQLRVLVPSLDAFEDFLRQKLTRIEGVSQLTTSLGLRPVVNRTSVPVAER